MLAFSCLRKVSNQLIQEINRQEDTLCRAFHAQSESQGLECSLKEHQMLCDHFPGSEQQVVSHSHKVAGHRGNL